MREVREETGLVAEIEASLGETRYFYVWEDVRIHKTVHFFLMRARAATSSDRDDEMEDCGGSRSSAHSSAPPIAVSGTCSGGLLRSCGELPAYPAGTDPSRYDGTPP